MKNNLLTFIGILLLTVALLSEGDNEGIFTRKKIVIKSQICNLKVKNVLIKANASMLVFALFSVDDMGRPKDIQVLDKEKITDWQEVKNCVKKWVLKGFGNGDQFCIAWYWRHGFGWYSMTIRGPDFEQTIQFENLIAKKTEERQ